MNASHLTSRAARQTLFAGLTACERTFVLCVAFVLLAFHALFTALAL